MSHRYFPHTGQDIKEMLERCGMESLDDLYSDVPQQLKLTKSYDVDEQMSEKEVIDFFDNLAAKNKKLICFAGGGYYDHYTPAVVKSIISRSEFLTAYTPYQPEISQGTLQYIFEYQSMISALTGLDVSNASMYDGTTAAAEAMMMAVANARKKNRVLAAGNMNPHLLNVLKTYARYHEIDLDIIPYNPETGATDFVAMETMLEVGNVAGVMVSSPNYFGILEDFAGVADLCHQNKALFIMQTIPSSLGIIKTPGEWGADVAVGDGQSLGMPLSYGGPYLGFMACKKSLIRKLPGRIVGATTDTNGKRVFVLTLQAREQHIRRDKATSNICSNQGLMSLFATVYLSILGADGLTKINEESYNGAHYLMQQLSATKLMRPKYPASPFLNEFVMKSDVNLDKLIAECLAQGILPGIKIADDEILIAVTEMQTRKQIDKFVKIVESFKHINID